MSCFEGLLSTVWFSFVYFLVILAFSQCMCIVLCLKLLCVLTAGVGFALAGPAVSTACCFPHPTAFGGGG